MFIFGYLLGIASYAIVVHLDTLVPWVKQVIAQMRAK